MTVISLMGFFKTALLLSALAVVAKAKITGKDYDRIFIIILENQNYADCVADPYFSTIAESYNGNVIREILKSLC